MTKLNMRLLSSSGSLTALPRRRPRWEVPLQWSMWLLLAASVVVAGLLVTP